MPLSKVKRSKLSLKLPSSRSLYRKKNRSSKCRSKPVITCRKTKGCKYIRGEKRKYCRKSKNTMRIRKAVSL